MRKVWQMLATFVLVTALAVSGHAGSGNGNGGGNGKGNKPNKEQKQKGPKEQKQKGPKGDKAAKQAEKEARKAEKLAAKEARKAAKAAEKAAKQAEKEARKAEKQNKGGNSSFSIAEVIVTDSRIVDLTGDYMLESVLVADDGTTATTSASVALVQDSRGRLVGTALITMPDGAVVEVPVVGHLQLSGQTNLDVHLEGELPDGSASVHIDGSWDSSAFQSVVTVMNFEEEFSYDAVIIPVNTVVGFIIEAPLSEQVIGNKVWSDRTVVLPWGNEVVRSQLMNKKGFKFMMHSGNFGIDLRGTADDTGVVSLSRAKLHLGYGSLWLDPATVEVIPAVPVVVE